MIAPGLYASTGCKLGNAINYCTPAIKQVTTSNVPVLSLPGQNLTNDVVTNALVLFLIFARGRDALVCMVPIVVADALLLGGMGYTGMPLGIATTMFASLTAGVGVDFAIHLVERYRRERESGSGHDRALARQRREERAGDRVERGRARRRIPRPQPLELDRTTASAFSWPRRCSPVMRRPSPCYRRSCGCCVPPRCRCCWPPPRSCRAPAWRRCRVSLPEPHRRPESRRAHAEARADVSRRRAYRPHVHPHSVSRHSPAPRLRRAASDREDPLGRQQRQRRRDLVALRLLRTRSARRHDAPAAGLRRLHEDRRHLALPAFVDNLRKVDVGSQRVMVPGTSLTSEDARGFIAASQYIFAPAGRAPREGETAAVACPRDDAVREAVGYDSLRIVVDTGKSLVRRVDYTDLGGKPLKSYTLVREVKEGGRWLPTEVRTEHQVEGSFAEITYEHWPLAKPPPADLYRTDVSEEKFLPRLERVLTEAGLGKRIRQEIESANALLAPTSSAPSPTISPAP